MTESGGPEQRTAAAALPATTPRAIHPWVAEQARRIRFGIANGPTASWSDLRAWVLRVEQLGFDSFWVADHTMAFPVDAWTALAALAVHTERLRLGTLVSCIYYRPPALLAWMAADVDRFSGGRLVLGVGSGTGRKSSRSSGWRSRRSARGPRRWRRPSGSCAACGRRGG